MDTELLARRSLGESPVIRQPADEAAAWQPPLINFVEEVEAGEALRPPSLDEIEAIHREAEQAGYEVGYAEGKATGYREALEAGQAEQRDYAERLRSIVDLAARPLADLDERVEAALVDLVILLARQIIRRELKVSPGEVVAVVREALSRLPMSTQSRVLHLHPEDIALVRGALGLPEQDPDWDLKADPLVARGGCLVETESSYVDATVEARIAAAVSRLLGGERESDRDEGTRGSR